MSSMSMGSSTEAEDSKASHRPEKDSPKSSEGRGGGDKEDATVAGVEEGLPLSNACPAASVC